VSNSRTNAGDEGKEGCTLHPPGVVVEKSECEVAISHRGRSPEVDSETFHNWLHYYTDVFRVWTSRCTLARARTRS
jgi:hypothetical protein